MPPRTKLLIISVVLSAGATFAWAAHRSSGSWLRFGVFLTAILLSSGLKVILPRGEGSMSLNFPFLLLAVVQLSPMQAMLLAAISVAAQCRVRVKKLFTAVQIVFNIANSVVATAIAWVVYVVLTKHTMASPPALALASIAFFLSSTVLVATAIATSKGEKVFVLWRAEFPWYLPFYFVGAVLAALANGIGARFGASTSLLLIPMVYTIYRAYTAQIVRAKEREQHLEETEALHVRTIEGLAMAIEAKDQETHEHLFRVRSYVTEVGTALKLSKLEMSALHTAAFLHDIGKLAVPEHIINKPGKLTLEEFEKMKIHPVVGADILDRVRFPYPVVPIVRSHHEWWNGQGYPDGLKGEEIPIGARILTVVDCFDALTSDRPYRKGKTYEDAMAMLRNLAGTQFDPAIVEIFQSRCLSIEEQARQGDDREFIPLNLQVDVWRGAAPGAGFEEQLGLAHESSEAIESETDVGVGQGEVQSPIQLLAAASQEAQVMFEMSESLATVLSLREVMSLLLARLRRYVPFDCCALYVKEGNGVVLQHVEGEHAKSFSVEPIRLGEGISGWVAQNAKGILNGNATVEPSYHATLPLEGSLRAALSIPMFDLEGEVFAVLTLYALSADSFSRDHLRTLQTMESKLSRSLQGLRRTGEAAKEVEADTISLLPDAKELFVELEMKLERCRRDGSSLAVIACGIEVPRDVDEDGGRAIGNKLLAKVAELFREGCRSYDTVARTGRTSFVLLLQNTSQEGLSSRLATIADVVNSAGRYCGVKSEVLAHVGASSFPEDSGLAEDLLSLAERRMYLDKGAHPAGVAACREARA